MAETVHQMKMRHKKELQELKKSKMSKKELKQLEATTLARHAEEVAAQSSAKAAEGGGGGDVKEEDKAVEGVAGEVEEKLNVTDTKPKMNKNQRRKANQAAREEARRKEIEEEVSQMSDPRADENALFALKLDPEHKTVHEIKADGHCLYRAIEHQLALTSTDSSTHCGYEKLREVAASHLLEHSGDFMGFITTKDGDPISDEAGYKAYCAKITDKQDVVWGGQVEVQAISAAIKRKITVHSAQAPPVVMGDDETQPTLHISYHQHWYTLGEHYNSVVPQ